MTVAPLINSYRNNRLMWKSGGYFFLFTISTTRLIIATTSAQKRITIPHKIGSNRHRMVFSGYVSTEVIISQSTILVNKLIDNVFYDVFVMFSALKCNETDFIMRFVAKGNLTLRGICPWKLKR